MGRLPLNTTEAVIAVIRQQLAEGCAGTPVTPAVFRRLVSARGVRERLGGGDLAWINRTIRSVEAQILAESAARNPIADLPDAVAGTMRALWQSAVAEAHDQLAAVHAEARRAIEDARAERDEAIALTAMLRNECDALQQRADAHVHKIGELDATVAHLARQCDEERERRQSLEGRLADALRAREQDRAAHQEELSAVRYEYDGLRRQLLLESDAYRQSIGEAHRALERELAACRQLLEQTTRERDRLADRVDGESVVRPAQGRAP
jgi:chromosome segregation ATPase